jgi:hypothetical protein
MFPAAMLMQGVPTIHNEALLCSERGNSEPGLEYIFRIAKGLQLPVTALLIDKEEDSNLLKKMQSLSEKATPDQLALLYRLAKVIVG